jgi:hypothetical protein
MSKPANLILHIGHYKTGTTALQVFCAANAAPLAAQGLIYSPFPLKLGKHSPLAFSLLRDAGVTTLMHGFDAPAKAPELWATLFDAVRSLDAGQTLLVSSEEFMRLGAHPGAAALLRDIMATAPDIRVRVIVYLRPPHSHLWSWYNQLIKMRIKVGSFETAVRSQMEPIHWDYARALAPWIEIFGAEQVELRQFHDGLRDGDALYADFLETLGFAVPVTAITPPRDPNPRLDDRILDIQRALLRANLPKWMVDQAATRMAANLVAEDAQEELKGTPDLDAIAQAARAGITTLATLPGAALDLGAMTADLPRIQDNAEARALRDLVILLAGELAHLRSLQQQSALKLIALEKRLDALLPGADGDR